MSRDYKLKGKMKDHPYALAICNKVNRIQDMNYYLTKWEYKFLENVFWSAANDKVLTQKQAETLEKIYKKALQFHNMREEMAYGSFQHSGFGDFEP